MLFAVVVADVVVKKGTLRILNGIGEKHTLATVPKANGPYVADLIDHHLITVDQQAFCDRKTARKQGESAECQPKPVLPFLYDQKIKAENGDI